MDPNLARHHPTNKKEDTEMADELTRAKKQTALVKFFGKLPGQSLAEIAQEMKPLSDSDVDELFGGISAGTLTY